jgi:hypothetical protein
MCKAPARGEGDGASGTVITDFAQVVYENLKTAGVQNTKKGERLMLENLRPTPESGAFDDVKRSFSARRKSAARCVSAARSTWASATCILAQVDRSNIQAGTSNQRSASEPLRLQRKTVSLDLSIAA